MIVVYLDQCAISALALDADKDPCIAQLRDSLLAAVHRGAAVCPVAGETLIETTGLLQKEQRIAIRELHIELAAGENMFKTIRELLHEETLALARSLPPPNPFFQAQWTAANDDAVAANAFAELNAGKDDVHRRVEQMPLIQLAGVNAKRIREEMLGEFAGHVWRQLERMLVGEEPDPKDCLGWELAIFLLRENITKPEMEKLMEDIRCHRWEQIPVVIFPALLGAAVEMDYRRRGAPKRHDPNDDIDICRLAVGCSVADMVITDGPMVNLARTARLSEWGACEVLAANEPRLAIECFQKLLQQHLELPDNASAG